MIVSAADDILNYFFSFFLEYRFWHFMQGNLHEMSNPIFQKKKSKMSVLLFAEFTIGLQRLWTEMPVEASSVTQYKLLLREQSDQGLDCKPPLFRDIIRQSNRDVKISMVRISGAVSHTCWWTGKFACNQSCPSYETIWFQGHSRGEGLLLESNKINVCKKYPTYPNIK